MDILKNLKRKIDIKEITYKAEVKEDLSKRMNFVDHYNVIDISTQKAVIEYERKVFCDAGVNFTIVVNAQMTLVPKDKKIDLKKELTEQYISENIDDILSLLPNTFSLIISQITEITLWGPIITPPGFIDEQEIEE